jgi:hypothetical protein
MLLYYENRKKPEIQKADTLNSVATGRASHAGQVNSEVPDKEKHPGPPDWGVGRWVDIPIP